MGLRIALVFASFILCQCAVKHQPQVFEPHFQFKPRRYLASDHVRERILLEQKESLTRLEQKRLLALYQKERAYLEPDSKEYEAVSDEVEYYQSELGYLSDELEEVREQTREARRDAKKSRSDRKIFRRGELKALYDDAYQLWNRNDNIEALNKAIGIENNTQLMEESNDEEKFKVHYLTLRIALDVGNLVTADKAFSLLKPLDECHEHTSKSGFLLALFHFSTGNTQRASQLLEEQCVTDHSIAAQIQRTYWKARFDESKYPNPEKAYEELFRFQVPGYHAYLAAARLNRKIGLPTDMLEGRKYLQKELSVSSRLNELWTAAEERLKAGLLRDAETYLLLASLYIKQGSGVESIPNALYTAHLLQAAGSQLEAMRLYAFATDLMAEERNYRDFDFVREMFPAPWASHVESMARQWDVDADLIYSLMRQESAFNPEAVSVADARGLLQIMPFVARNLADQWGYGAYYGDRYLFHGEENLKWAIFHLHQLKAKAPHFALMVASYNAGLARVSQWWKRFGHLPLDVFVEMIPVEETQQYVKLVMRNFLYYKALRENGVVRDGWIPLQLPPYPQSSLSE